MSNPTPPDDSQDQTLAALHGLGSEEEAADHDEHDGHDEAADPSQLDPEGRDDAAPSAAASGFVGMLAKEGAAGNSESLAADVPTRPRTDKIEMAREISPDQLPPGIGRASPRTPARKTVKQVPDWYHAAVPVMYTLGSLLMLIGLWAVGAIIYMAIKSPSDAEVGYWWIAKHMSEDTGVWSYSSSSKIMAVAMLICIPVSFAMTFMGAVMRKQIRFADRAAGK